MSNALTNTVDSISSFLVWGFNYFLANPIKGIISLALIILLIFMLINLIKWFLGIILNRRQNKKPKYGK